MKKNTGSVWIAVVIILILAGAGAYYLWGRGPVDYAVTPTPAPGTPNPVVGGQPIVSTGTAAPVTQSTVVFAGTVNPNGGQTSYWYEYGTSQSLGSFASPQLIGSGVGNFSAPGTLVGLTPNTTYYYRLTAENQYGKVFGSTMTFKTATVVSTATPPPPPPFALPSVSTRDASAITHNSATLNATLNPNGVRSLYWFEYGKTLGLGTISTASPTDAMRANLTVSTNLFALEPNTMYYYRLNAQNVNGTVIGNISVFTTQPTTLPPPPAGQAPSATTLAATSITNSSVTLRGEINPRGAATTYRFEYGKSTPFGVFNLTERTANQNAGTATTTSTFSANITSLDRDSTYYYQLVSENQYGTTRGAIHSFTTED